MKTKVTYCILIVFILIATNAYATDERCTRLHNYCYNQRANYIDCGRYYLVNATEFCNDVQVECKKTAVERKPVSQFRVLRMRCGLEPSCWKEGIQNRLGQICKEST